MKANYWGIILAFTFLLGRNIEDASRFLFFQTVQSQEEFDFWPEEQDDESAVELKLPEIVEDKADQKKNEADQNENIEEMKLPDSDQSAELNEENQQAEFQKQLSEPEINADEQGTTPPKTIFKRASSFFSSAVEDVQSTLPDESSDNEVKEAIEGVIPAQSLMFVQTVSIQKLDEIGKYLLSQVGFVGFSPLSLLKWTAYGNSIKYLDLKRSLAVVYCLNESKPVRLLVFPVKNGSAFIRSLGGQGELTDNEGVVYEIQGPNPSFIYLKKGYAVLVSGATQEKALQYYNDNSIAQTNIQLNIPQGLVHSQIKLIVLPHGIQYFSTWGESALNDFKPFWSGLLNSLEQSDSSQTTEFGLNLKNGFQSNNEIDFNYDEYFQKGEEGFQWVRQNVQSFRMDCVVRKDASVCSLIFKPKPSSELERQILDSFVPTTPTILDEKRFLKVLPEIMAPVSGQMDITQNVAEKLEAPFNRLRHVEYSLSLPQNGELLAESWAFFLEVDNSEQFIKELIVPKAKLIGGHIGSEKAGEIGSQILGNLAVRRQNRQSGRNRIWGRPADPQAAAEQGERIGSLLGGLIGQSAGENEAMKQYDFEGYPLYVSDLELYDREMRKIRAKETGQMPPQPVFLTGEPTLMVLLGNLLNGIENGNLENATRSALTQFSPDMNEKEGEQSLLMARYNYILVLDDQHLLIVPGNESLLRAAKNNWELVRHNFITDSNSDQYRSEDKSLPIFSSEIIGWEKLWDDICWEMPEAIDHHLRSSTQLNIFSAQILCEYIRQNYASNLPGPFAQLLPKQTPSTLAVSTTNGDLSYLYFAISHLTVKNVIKTFFLNAKTK